jgi:hypothetical protein
MRTTRDAMTRDWLPCHCPMHVERLVKQAAED